MIRTEDRTEAEKTIRIVFDPELKKPACVLIQSAYGCGEANGIISRIDARLWLTAPTKAMRIFEMPIEEALKFPDQCNAYHKTERQPPALQRRSKP